MANFEDWTIDEIQKLIKYLRNSIGDFKIDKTDLLILVFCEIEIPPSVSDLQRALGIAYKNLLPHLRRLKKYDFIKIVDKGLGRRKEIITNFENKNVKAFFELAQLRDILRNGKNTLFKDKTNPK